MYGREWGLVEKGVPETEGAPDPDPDPGSLSESRSRGMGETAEPGVPDVVGRGAGGSGVWKFCEGESMTVLEEWW